MLITSPSARVRRDIEGAEYAVLPRLLATGAACLIDELYLECHFNMESNRPELCISLLGAMRGVGVPAFYGH